MKSVILCLFLMFVTFCFAEEDIIQSKHLLSSTAQKDLENSGGSVEFAWIPEVSLQYALSDLLSFQAEYSFHSSIDLRWNDDISSEDIDTKSYRAWLRLSIPQAELRVGLQRLSFGSAQILRPLQWFDRINPLDANEMTGGVDAILWRYYFVNSANLWCWLIQSDGELLGNEYIPSQKDGYQMGGRIQYPFQYLDTAISYHRRELILSPSDSGIEHRIGIDLRHDSFASMWFESSASLFQDEQVDFHSSSLSAMLGMDYTVGIGNGLHAVMESMLLASIATELYNIRRQESYTALMLDYPLGILDHVTLLNLYDWEERSSLHSFLWRRTYDHLGLELGISHDLNRDFYYQPYQMIHLKIQYNI